MLKQSLVIFATLAFSHISVADNSYIKINSFSVGRSGGGQFAAVAAKVDGKIQVYTDSCNFYQLSADEQLLTRFELTGRDKVEANAILENKALFASEEHLGNPMPTGSWSYFALDYSFPDHDGETILNRHTEIPEVIILLNNARTDIASRIERLARNHSNSVCHPQM